MMECDAVSVPDLDPTVIYNSGENQWFDCDAAIILFGGNVLWRTRKVIETR